MKTGYDSIDEAYKDLMPEMINYAKRHLFNRDYAVDAAQDTFVKVSEYISKHPQAKIASFIIMKELKRSIRRINKKNQNEISVPEINELVAEYKDAEEENF